MKREIKFRGKIANDPNIKGLNKGDWWTGFYYEDLDDGEWKSFIKCGELDLEVDKDTVGQFTGLLDKNGNEIYEGDIVQAYHSTSNIPVRVGEIMFIEGSFCYCYGNIKITLLNLYSDLLEVIGNIHDNPELIEGGAE